MKVSNDFMARLLDDNLKDGEVFSLRIEVQNIIDNRVTIQVVLIDSAGVVATRDEPRELGETDTLTVELSNPLTLQILP